MLLSRCSHVAAATSSVPLQSSLNRSFFPPLTQFARLSAGTYLLARPGFCSAPSSSRSASPPPAAGSTAATVAAAASAARAAAAAARPLGSRAAAAVKGVIAEGEVPEAARRWFAQVLDRPGAAPSLQRFMRPLRGVRTQFRTFRDLRNDPQLLEGSRATVQEHHLPPPGPAMWGMELPLGQDLFEPCSPRNADARGKGFGAANSGPQKQKQQQQQEQQQMLITHEQLRVYQEVVAEDRPTVLRQEIAMGRAGGASGLNLLAMMLLMDPKTEDLYCYSRGRNFWAFLKKERKIIRLRLKGSATPADFKQRFPGLDRRSSVLLYAPNPEEPAGTGREFVQQFACRTVTPELGGLASNVDFVPWHRKRDWFARNLTNLLTQDVKDLLTQILPYFGVMVVAVLAVVYHSQLASMYRSWF